MTTPISNSHATTNNVSTIPPTLPHYVIHNNIDSTISVSMPIDRASMKRMCYILELPRSLKEITFTPALNPVNNVSRLENEVSETLIWFFGLSKDTDLIKLERVLLPLEFQAEKLAALFRRLSKLTKLKSLTFRLPTSYNYMAPSLRPGLDHAVWSGIVSLTQLQEITLPAAMVNGKILGALTCLFAGSVSSNDGTIIRFFR